MFKLAIKQFRTEYPGFMGTLIAIIATCVLGMTTFQLLGTVIIDLIKNGSTEKTMRAVSMFGSVCGFLVILAVSSLMLAINYSVKRRTKIFSNLRILGMTYQKISGMVIIETMVMSLVGLILGIFIGTFIAIPIFNNFKDIHVVPENLSITWNPIIIIFTSMFMIILGTITAWNSARKLKNTTIDNGIDESNSKNVTVFRIIMGVILIATPIIVYSFVDMTGGRASIYIIISLFIPILGFSLVNKYILIFIFSGLKKVFRFNNFLVNTFSSLKTNILKFTNVVMSLALVITFQGVLSSNYSIMIDSKQIIATKFYKGLNAYNAEKGFEYDKLSTVNTSLIYNGKTKYDDKTTNYQMVKGKLIFDFGQELKVNELKTNEAIITSDFPNYGKLKVGDQIKFNIGQKKVNFTIVSKLNSILRSTGFNPLYIGYNKDHVNEVKNIDVFSKNEIINNLLIKYDPLVKMFGTKSPLNTLLNLILIIVVIFSIINILNFLFLYIFDKKSEYKLERVLGITRRGIIKSNFIEITSMIIMGVVYGLYSVFTFTIPYSLSNVVGLVLVANPFLFSGLILVIFICSILFGIAIQRHLVKK